MNVHEATGKTLDDAIKSGLSAMGVARDAVSVEILQNPKKGFFGLGETLAKVKLTRNEPEKSAPKPPPVKFETPKPAPKPAEPRPEPVQRGESRPAPKPAYSNSRPPRPQDRPQKFATAVPPTRPTRPTRPVQPAGQEQFDAAKEFVTGLLDRMNIGASSDISLDENGIIRVLLGGENLGSLIGRRGDTLDAIQHLASNIVNKEPENNYRVNVDAAGYREKRQDTLEKLARRMAENAVKYRNNMVLEPMNAYERHIIHTALQDVPGITTYSTGSEPQRCVVIAPQRNTGGGNYRNNNRSRPPRRDFGDNSPRRDFNARRNSPPAPEPRPAAQPAASAPEPQASRGLPMKEFGGKKD